MKWIQKRKVWRQHLNHIVFQCYAQNLWQTCALLADCKAIIPFSGPRLHSSEPLTANVAVRIEEAEEGIAFCFCGLFQDECPSYDIAIGLYMASL